MNCPHCNKELPKAVQDKLFNSFKNRNIQVYLRQEAVFEKVGYGIVDVTYQLHNKRITHLKIYGKATKYFNQRKSQSSGGDNKEGKVES